MRPLVSRWDAKVRADVGALNEPAAEIAERQSVLREPASAEDIAAAEARLGRRLPPSYRAFLEISDGAHASTLGAETKGARGVPLRHGLFRARDLRLLADVDEESVRLWTELDLGEPADRSRPTDHRPVEVESYEPLGEGVLISEQLDAFCSVLVPRDDADEWELWAFAKEGAVAYRSFADWLQWEIERPPTVPAEPPADELVERIHRGELHHLHVLGERGDARVVELALEVLEDEEVYQQTIARLRDSWPGPEDRLRTMADRERVLRAAHIVQRRPTRRAIAPLRRALERVTSAEARLTALAALEACGDPDIDDLLERSARCDPDEQVRRWAAWRLRARCGDEAGSE